MCTYQYNYAEACDKNTLADELTLQSVMIEIEHLPITVVFSHLFSLGLSVNMHLSAPKLCFSMYWLTCQHIFQFLSRALIQIYQKRLRILVNSLASFVRFSKYVIVITWARVLCLICMPEAQQLRAYISGKVRV